MTTTAQSVGRIHHGICNQGGQGLRHYHPPSPLARSLGKKCWAYGAVPLPDNWVYKDCLRDYVANWELESQQVVDLLEQTMKDFFSKLATIIHAQPVPQVVQVQDTEHSILGPSAVSTRTDSQ